MDMLLRRRAMFPSKKDYIEFADPEVLRVLLANGIGDGTGITVAQAAAVNIGYYIFDSNTAITSFDEFKYFTRQNVAATRFGSATNLESITLPPQTTSLTTRMFSNGPNRPQLRRVTFINNNVLTGGAYAFQKNTTLQEVHITNLNNWLKSSLSDNPTNYAHHLYLNTESDLYSTDNEVTSVVFPSDMTSIPTNCLAGCSSITSVTIPNTITSIGAYAFNGCSGLASLTISSHVTSIGAGALQNCSGLTGTLTIPSSVTSIGGSSTFGCVSIDNFIIHSSGTFAAGLFGHSMWAGTCGNGTGLFYHKGSLTNNSECFLNFKHYVIEGDYICTNYGVKCGTDDDRVAIAESIRIGGDYSTTASSSGNAMPISPRTNRSNQTATFTNFSFAEILGTISSSVCIFVNSANSIIDGFILHLGYDVVANNEFPCTPSIAGANLSRIAKIYVGDGSSAAHDNAILAQYLADADWATYSAKLDTWYNYVQSGGKYATPPTIPTE